MPTPARDHAKFKGEMSGFIVEGGGGAGRKSVLARRGLSGANPLHFRDPCCVGRALHFARIPGVRCDFGYYFFCDCSFLLSDPHVPIFDTAHTGAPGGGPQWSESHSNGGPCNPPAALRFGSRLPTPTVLRGFAPLRPSPGGASMSGIENGDERALGFA